MNRARWWITAAVIAAGAVCAAVVAWREPRDPLVRLARAAGRFDTRITEPRLSGFAFRPRPTSSPQTHDAAHLRFRALAGKVLQSTAYDDHAAGVAALLVGANDDAVKRLTAFAETHPNDASVWNDLAAARYTAANANDDPQQLVSALASADHALRIALLPEASFNRALTLESIGLYAAAAKQYDAYVAMNAHSAWAEEARQRTTRLRVPTAVDEWQEALPRLKLAAAHGDDKTVQTIVRQFPQESESWSETIFLGEWGAAVLRGDVATADNRLRVAEAVGRAITGLNGDSLLRDAVAAIRTNNVTSRRMNLATAYVDYYLARSKYGDRKVSETTKLFKNAARLFLAARSPMAFAAQFYLCSALHDLLDDAGASDLLHILSDNTPREYRSLRAHILWDKALIASRRGNLFDALQLQQIAALTFHQLGERTNEISMRSQAAASAAVMGFRADAWRQRRDLFRLISASGDAIERQRTIDVSARAEGVAEEWNNAYSLLNLAAEPDTAVNPNIQAYTLVWLAITAKRIGLPIDALSAIQRAHGAAARIPDRQLSHTADLAAVFGEATIIRDRQPKRAIELLTQFLEASPSALLAPEALLERARASRFIGANSSAVTDLYHAAVLLDERSARSHDEYRDSFFRTADSVSRELCDTLLATGRIAAAALTVDSARGAPYHVTTSLANLQLPPHITAVTYLALPTQLLIFTHTGSSVQVHRVRASAESIKKRCSAALDDPAAANDCGKWMLWPIAPEVARAHMVIISPDNTLGSTPFAMLPIHRAGPYLIERAAIVVTPSIGFALDEGSLTARRPLLDYVVAVGDPQFDAERFPKLPTLPSSGREATTISRLYSRGLLLTRDHATPSRVLEAMRTATILHISSHAISATNDPRRSLLVLARSTQDDGTLSVQQVLAIPKLPLRLVVLGGCKTGLVDGTTTHVASLALAFLAVGAESAIGTIADIPDEVSPAFSIELHRRLRMGMNPVEATRDAQLQLLHSSDPRLRQPRGWASIQFIGRAKNSARGRKTGERVRP